MATSRVVDGVTAAPRRIASSPLSGPRIRERRRARAPRSRPCGPQHDSPPRLVHRNAESASNQSHAHLFTRRRRRPRSKRAASGFLNLVTQRRTRTSSGFEFKKLESALTQNHEVHGDDAARAERRRPRSWLTTRRIATHCGRARSARAADQPAPRERVRDSTALALTPIVERTEASSARAYRLGAKPEARRDDQASLRLQLKNQRPTRPRSAQRQPPAWALE